MRPILCCVLFLLLFSFSQAQFARKSLDNQWDRMLLVSKYEGINTSGFEAVYYKNNNLWWNDWFTPWSIGLQSTRIRNDKFEESEYLSADLGYITLGITGFKNLTEKLYINIDLGVNIGFENLIDLNSTPQDRFIIGLSSSQGILYIPNTNSGFVFKAGIYEEVLTSKLYTYDVGAKFGAGFVF